VVHKLKLIYINLENLFRSRGFINTLSQIADDFKKPSKEVTMTVTGSRKQEGKIDYLSTIAQKMFPEIALSSFKDAFRQGVESALKTHQYEQWSDVVKEQPLARKVFFESILGGMTIYLKQTGLHDEQIERLVKQLSRRNKRFLG